MSNRNYKIRSLSVLSSLLLLFVLVLANAVFARSAIRIDLTEEGLYTLSPASEKVLGSIQDPVTIKVFWHDVPSRFDASERYIRALLEEMETISDDKLSVRWIGMDSDEGKAEAESYSLTEHTFLVRDAKGASQQSGYMSLVIESGNQKAKVLNELSNIRYELEKILVKDIYQRQRSEPPIIGVAIAEKAMRGPRNPGRFQLLQKTLYEEYQSSARVFLSLQDPIAPDVRVLIVAAPESLSERELFHFDQFVMRGGRAIVLVDNVYWENVNGMAHQREPRTAGIEEWFAQQGITIEIGFCGDWNEKLGGLYPLPQNQGWIRSYPYWPAMARELGQLDADHPLTKHMRMLRLYWPQAISVDEVRQEDEGRTVTVLAKTSRYGERRKEILSVGTGEGIEMPPEGELQETPVIVLLEGPMDSYFKGKPAPAKEDKAGPGMPGLPGGLPPGLLQPGGPGGRDADGDGDDEEEPAPPLEDEEPADPEQPAEPTHLQRGEACRVLLVGDAEFASDAGYVRAPQMQHYNGDAGGIPFLANAVEWMTGSEDLLALRAKVPMARNIEKVEDSTQKLIKWANVIVMPLLVLFAGIVIFIVRRVRQV